MKTSSPQGGVLATLDPCPPCPRLCGRGLSTPTDCLCCGVCCFSTLDTYVRVTGADWDRLGAETGRVAHFIGNRAYMRMRDGRCAALESHRMADEAGVFFCTVYEKRPQVCRDLARGSPECQGERDTKAERVARAELEIFNVGRWDADS